MKRTIEEFVGDAIARWVGRGRHCVLTVVVSLAVTAAIAVYTVGHLGINGDANSLFSEDLPYRVLENRYAEQFPAVTENIVVVIDSDSPEMARDGAAALASRMRDAADLFDHVYLPQGAFFEDHALLYMDAEELEDFADRMARVQPYLAALALDGTLRGLSKLLARGVTALPDGSVDNRELGPMLERFSGATRALLVGERFHVSWAEVVAGRKLDVNDRRRYIFARPLLDLGEFVAAARPLEAVRTYARELGLDAEHGATVRITGDVALSYEEMQLVKGEAASAGVISFVLVGIVLLVALRSLWLLMATLITLIVGLLWTAGFAAFAIGHLNVISVAFAVLFIGLSVDFSIHLCMRYQELLGRGLLHSRALRETGRDVGASIALCAVTTAIGFYAFVPTDFSGVAQLGLIAGTGMFISLLASLTLLPALMSLGRRFIVPARLPDRSVRFGSLLAFPVRHPLGVVMGALVLAAGALLLLPGVYFDADPLRVRDPGAESVQTYEELLTAGGTSPLNISVIAPDLASAQTLALRLSQLDEIDEAITLRDFVPTDQVEKLAIIEDVALFLAPATRLDEREPAPTRGDEVSALTELRDELDALVRDGGDAELLARARQAGADIEALLSALSDDGRANELVSELEASMLDSLPGQLAMLERLVKVGPVTLDSLPDGLKRRMISADGSARVQISPSEDLSDNQALARFVAATRQVTPDAIGSAVNVYEAIREAVRALRQALGAAVGIIALLLFLIWRTLGDTALVMTPLGLAALLTAAAGVLVNIPLNFADIIVLPLLLGIGVDSGIHLVERSRRSGGGATHLLESSTAHAVLFSSLTTIASFGSLALAGHRGMATMGQLLTIGVGLAVVANLVLLPGLIELRSRRRLRAV
ncbi:MAG: hopanoid biosynthesis-associated RND transporter HpnN [Myxococcales bacterium]|nr:MAG: hopanoid biosynthesis-associated RND transporter HpnN [Myxococcales bacterium]